MGSSDSLIPDGIRRTGHYLKTNRGCQHPSRYIVLEAALEPCPGTDPDAPFVGRATAFCARSWRLEGGVVCRENQCYGSDLEELWRWIHRRAQHGTATWVFGLGMYPLLTGLGFWGELEAGAFTMTGADPWEDLNRGERPKRRWRGYLVLENPPTIIMVRSAQCRGTLRCVDIANYGVSGWAALAESMGAEIPPQPGELAEPEQKVAWCRSRADVLTSFVRSLIDVIRDNGLGSLQSTAGSQAMSAYRTKFLRFKVLCHTDAGVQELERSCQYGGRCEVRLFGMECGPGWHLDISAMYPSICAENSLPCRLVAQRSMPRAGVVERWLYRWDCCADVLVRTSVPAYPKKGDAVVTWPVGQFRTSLCGPELVRAAHRGELQRVYGMAAYESEPLLSEYMQQLYVMRMGYQSRGQLAHCEVVKRLMVSLPGKFAQRRKSWVDRPDELAALPYALWYEPDPVSGIMIPHRSVAWCVQAMMDLGFHREAVPALYAWVTAAGRMRLLSLIETAGWRNVWYYDTDSLWVNAAGREALERAGQIGTAQMGQLRVVHPFERATFRGIKHYVVDGRVVCAGLRHDIGLRDDLLGAGWTAGVWTACLERQQTPELGLVTPPDTGYGDYRHGRVTDSGWVEPLYVWEMR